MKKIAIITKNTTYHKSYGGLETHTKHLIDFLAQEGFKVDIYNPKRELRNQSIQESNRNYYFLDVEYKTGPLSYFFRKHWYQGLLNSFNSRHQQENYDLVISISSAGYPIIENKFKYQFKILSICHGSALSEFKSLINEQGYSSGVLKNFPYFLYNYLIKQKKFIQGSDSIVAVSTYVKSSLVDECQIDPNLIKVIHNGAKIEDFKKEFRQKEPLKVLFAGRLERSKGVLVLIESVKNLEVELIIAGGGSLESEAKNLVKTLNIDRKVTFLGKLSSTELSKYYRQADILVAPSLRIEGFPMSIVEGMSYYLPIIATKIGGNDDAVFSSRNGFLISPNDAEELKERINFFDIYPEKIKQFGSSSRDLAEQKFNLELMKKNYLEVINSLVK